MWLKIVWLSFNEVNQSWHWQFCLLWLLRFSYKLFIANKNIVMVPLSACSQMHQYLQNSKLPCSKVRWARYYSNVQHSVQNEIAVAQNKTQRSPNAHLNTHAIIESSIFYANNYKVLNSSKLITPQSLMVKSTAENITRIRFHELWVS